MRTKKPNNTQVNQAPAADVTPAILEAVEAALLNGKARATIHAEATAEGIDAGAIDKALAIIVDQWVSDAAEPTDKARAFQIRALKHLYAKAYRLNDYKAAAGILKDLARIQGVTGRPAKAAAPASAASTTTAPDDRRARALALVTGKK